MPSVDRGQYPAKITIDQSVTISADIFTDGIDAIAACVMLRHGNDKQKRELPLVPADNDRWQAAFVPDKLGRYQFQVVAWINPFATWQSAIEKKYHARQDITVDLKGGVALAAAALARAAGRDRAALQKWMEQVEAADNFADGYKLSRDMAINTLLCKYRDKDRTTLYPHTFELICEPVKAMFSTWYELFPRSAAAHPGRHGTFDDVARLLPRIAHMGFDVLYLPPIHPIGEVNRKGRNNSLNAGEDDPGSPWAIGNARGGHKDVHAQLGTIKDFRRLVAAAQQQGIDIAMDIAFQCAPDHPYVQQHPEWFKWRADGTVQFAENPPKKYEDILPLNFESDAFERLWQELKSIFTYWIGNGVSIFRIDNPHTKSMPFWEWVIGELKSEHPQLIFLAEAFTRPRIMEHLAKTGFTQSYTYFAWRNKKKEIEEYVTELTTTDLQYYFRPNFWPNTPDILTSELVHGGEPAHIIRLVLAATLCASYGLYAPVYEMGISEPMPGKEEYNDNEKYEIKHWDWNGYTRIREVITRINRIRKENIALQTNSHIEFAETDNEHIICYMRFDAQRRNIVIVAVNLDPHNTQAANVKLPLYKAGMSYDRRFEVHDLLSGDRYQWGEWNFVSLAPHDMPAHVFIVDHQ